MTKNLTSVHMLCAAIALSGCGSHAALRSTMPAQVATSPVTSSTADAIAINDSTVTAASAEVAMPITPITESFAAAPWSAEPMAATAAPRALLTAWRRADNRTDCAPLAPSSLGAGMGARARSASYAGGWAVEFDKAGLPGITASGETCARCGRGAFGIAGTTMTPDALDEDLIGSERWSDGSHADVQATDEDPAHAGRVATLVVSGQDCVYQVWSFLGEDHLRELVAGLRRVDPQ